MLPQVGLAVAAMSPLFLRAPPRPQLRFGQRPRNQVTLCFLAPVRAQEVELGGGFDALGDAAQAKRMRQRNDRLRDRFVVAVLLDAVDDIEDLVAGFSRKIWQKITILETLGRAIADSKVAGEASKDR